MPSFPKPAFEYIVGIDKEIKALRSYKKSKPSLAIPAGTNQNLLLATWNIANFGDQHRETPHIKMLAEIVSWFDLVAIQEIKNNSGHFMQLVGMLGNRFGYIFSDASGNNERMAFLYRKSKVKILSEVAELDIPPSALRHVKLPGVEASFNGFDRSPYLAAFKANTMKFSLLNVHLYFGSDSQKASIERRSLEAYCIGRWADLRSEGKFSYTKTVFALGDFNLPKFDKNDPIYKALVQRGLQLPEHTSKVYSNINNDKAYDQIAFLPGLKSKIISHGVFPFDNVVFADLYKNSTTASFKSYVKYYLSDHRPMWMELSTT